MKYQFDRELQRLVPKDMIELPLHERKAWADGEDKSKKDKPFIPPRVHVVSDDLGKNGVHNPVNGKKYDSKSAYYRAVADAGCHINDAASTDVREQKPDTIGLKTDIATAMSQHNL